jgi:hypothetical protein
VSLLSRKLSRIYYAPSGIAGLTTSKFFDRSVPLAFSIDRADESATSWQKGLTCLGQAVSTLGAGPVQIILSNHYLRYQLFPWQADLHTAEEELHYARFAVSKTYGTQVDGWEVTLSDGLPGSARVVAAYDAGLLTALSAAVEDAGGRLVSVRPCMFDALNLWVREIDACALGWFVVYESGLLTLAFIESGQFKWIRNRRVDADWAVHLHEIITDEAMFLSTETAGSRVLLFSPDKVIEEVPPHTNIMPIKPLSLSLLRQKRALDDARYEFAWVV